MPRLVLGPLLRHVDETSATIWVETDAPCEVRVLDAASRTFEVHGHHYALVDVEGLKPDVDLPYQVTLDEEQVWPTPGSPAGRIRTLPRDGDEVRVVFGSCRHSGTTETHGHDALRAYAEELSRTDDLPTALLLVGDQVYADGPPPEVEDFARSRRDLAEPPYTEVADFEEYTRLYRHAWGTDPLVRWLLSTVPTYMIFDDHDVRDDWNASHAWREEVTRTAWWRDRIVGGLGTYWIYQHLGNLSPAERAADPLLTAVREHGDAVLDAAMERADTEPDTRRWSYARDLGRTRLVVVDSRCARVLDPARRMMLTEAEMTWVRDRLRGDVDHLLIATSLPYLLPPGVHHAEAWNEALCRGAWGRWLVGLSERLRQGYDLEHWAAFDASFHTMAEAALDAARTGASVTFLSGDVHFSYLARADGEAITQVVCSPLRNPLPRKIRGLNAAAAWPVAGWAARAAAALAGVRKSPLRWRLEDGPHFGNAIATIETVGRAASVRWAEPDTRGGLTERARAALVRGDR